MMRRMYHFQIHSLGQQCVTRTEDSKKLIQSQQPSLYEFGGERCQKIRISFGAANEYVDSTRLAFYDIRWSSIAYDNRGIRWL